MLYEIEKTENRVRIYPYSIFFEKSGVESKEINLTQYPYAETKQVKLKREMTGVRRHFFMS